MTLAVISSNLLVFIRLPDASSDGLIVFIFRRASALKTPPLSELVMWHDAPVSATHRSLPYNRSVLAESLNSSFKLIKFTSNLRSVPLIGRWEFLPVGLSCRSTSTARLWPHRSHVSSSNSASYFRLFSLRFNSCLIFSFLTKMGKLLKGNSSELL